MKRISTAAAVVMLIGAATGSADAAQGQKRPRTINMAYAPPVVAWGGIVNVCIGSSGCGSVMPQKQEHFITIEATDTTGQPVPMTVTQDADGDFIPELQASVCGSTSEPIEISPRAEVHIQVSTVGHEPTCLGPATAGTISVSLATSPEAFAR